MTFRSDFDRAHNDLRLSFEMAVKQYQEEIVGLESDNQNLSDDIQRIHTDRLEFAKAADTAEKDFADVMDEISKVPDWVLRLCGADIDNSFYRRALDIKMRLKGLTNFCT